MILELKHARLLNLASSVSFLLPLNINLKYGVSYLCTGVALTARKEKFIIKIYHLLNKTYCPVFFIDAILE